MVVSLSYQEKVLYEGRWPTFLDDNKNNFYNILCCLHYLSCLLFFEYNGDNYTTFIVVPIV